MTEAFEALQERPQQGLDLGRFNYDERSQVRQIKVEGTNGHNPKQTETSLQTVYYLVGDEREAAAVFAEVNDEQLATLDFSKNNVIRTSVDRILYDWILHALGERRLQKFETAVLEERPDGTIWCIDRQLFENHPSRRYNTAGPGTARVTGRSLQALFDDLGADGQITEADLAACDDVEGDSRQVLDVFRQGEFSCVPTTVDDDLAVQIISDEAETDALETDIA